MASGYDWPTGFDRTPETMREPYPHGFQVSVQDAFENITTQLERLGADDYSIQSAADHQTRNPNLPYAGADPDDPSVVARYRKDGETFAVPCDRWDNLRDNAQAVAKYIDAKRALDRYGIETKTTEWETQIISGDAESDGGHAAADDGGVSATDTEVYDPDGGTCPDCGADLPSVEGVGFCPECGIEL